VRRVRTVVPLHVRVAAIGVAVMALILAVVALLTSQLIQVGHRSEVDRVLALELDEARRELPVELAVATGADGVATPAETAAAVQRFLAVHPGSAQHLVVVEIGPSRLSTRDGPAALQRLELAGRLPTAEPGRLISVASPAGDLRMMSAVLLSAGRPVGTVTVVGPLAAGQQQATDALVRIAAAGSVGLVLGGVLLLLAVRRALGPVRNLVAAARSVDLRDLDTRVPEPDRLDEVGTLAHEFNRMLERIGADERRRRQLLSAVSHELRTPLAVARGHVEVFESVGPTATTTAAGTAAVIRRELERLGRIVDDLSAVSRGDLGRTTERDPVFAPDVVATLAHRLDGLGLGTVELAEVPPVVLLGDEDRIAQALLNLVMNARTHNPEGTPVSVRARTEGGRIVFTVADGGRGIEPELFDSVFEPFVTSRPSGPGRASGLGLAVVKAVTEAQGGSVELRSGPDGTAVELAFDLDSADRAPIDRLAAGEPAGRPADG
jgi:two-component system, OmpR family, sensor kinase